MNVRNILHRLKVPHATVCQLADVLPTEMSAFLRSRRAVSEVKATRIERVTEELREFLENKWPQAQATLPVPFPLDLRDAAALRQLIDFEHKSRVAQQDESEAVAQIQNLFQGNPVEG
jgi:hypothetical protein